MPEKYGDSEFRETFSKIIVKDIEKIDGLIKDLLSFSDEKTLQFRESVNSLNIVSLVDEVIEHLRDKLGLEKKKISVEKIYKSDKINVLGEYKKLRQAFINIITNSCQAMGEKGVLTINITQNERRVNITITDTGPGIPYEDIDRIFDPFYTTKPTGVGLGLAISRKIIEDHGGSIKVESELSRGATFVVSLPVSN
jgi:signal transduction histidine kinase